MLAALCAACLAAQAMALAETPVIAIVDEAPTASEGMLEVYLLEIGAADCFLVRQGEETLLIDSGPVATGERVLQHLKRLGVTALTYAFLSHPHEDHAGGYEAVLGALPVGTLLMPEGFAGGEEPWARQLMDMADAEGIPVRSVQSGQSLSIGVAEIAFYQWDAPEQHVNNRSMIARLSLGARSVLFAADIENAAQLALSEAHGDALKADILKMPHHGLAAYMREFHAAVQPALAVFTNAEHRIMKRTMTLTKQRGIEWMVTTTGTVMAVTDGARPWQLYQLPVMPAEAPGEGHAAP